MLHDHPTFCLSSSIVPHTSDSELQTSEFPVHNPGLCLQAFIHFNCFFLYLFTIQHHRHKIKPNPHVIVSTTRFLPFLSLILKKISISVLVHMSVTVLTLHIDIFRFHWAMDSLEYAYLFLCT